MTKKNNFYLAIINSLRSSTNLSNIQKKLKISKQQLNYYLRKLKQGGIIIQKGRGWYEVRKEVKISTKYGVPLSKDSIRGHAYIWTIELPKEIEGWNKRIEILKSKGVHFKLVGALGTTPRIKVLGRKVWLCNRHLRIFDKPNNSYFGDSAKESRYLSFQEVKTIVGALNRKLGVFLKPSGIRYRKEHYALIKNDLAIEENRRGNIIRIRDEDGEWLLVDDSNGQGGELETIGKDAYKINVPMQKWWNDHKRTNFQLTPTFLMEAMAKVTQNQEMFARNIEEHMQVLKDMRETLKKIQEGL